MKCQNESIMRLQIPPHGVHCMSSLKNAKLMTIISQCFCPETSAKKSKFIFFTFFLVTSILGFLIKIFYIRFMTCLLNIFIFSFYLLFFLYHRPKCKKILSFLVLSKIFCDLKGSCSCFICLFSVSNSNISCLKVFTMGGSFGILN